MYFRNNAGGWNKSHGQVEQTPRIDAFELAHTGTHGGILYGGGRWLDIYHDDERCELYPLGQHPVCLRLSHKPNGYGGAQTFFLCPACGVRRRYLYGPVFLCRSCARLNYKSQQQTRDSMTDYHNGMAFAERRLDVHPRFRPDGFSFVGYVPDRPRGMHDATYRRLLARFLKYRERHTARLLADLSRITAPFR